MARLLFFTPVLPCPTGQGSAIRASIAVEILSEKHAVTVIHVDLWGGRDYVMYEEWVRTCAVGYHLIPAPVAPGAAQDLVSRHLADANIEAVYVFRLAAAPLALQVMGLLGSRRLPSALDLDDDESSRAEKFIPLREAAGDRALANRERAELQRLRIYQRVLLSRFDVSLLAAAEDRDSLAARYPDQKFALLPNVVRLPTPALHREDLGAHILFLGTLNYLPNEDAVRYFCHVILPLLQLPGHPVSLHVVGTNAPDSVLALGGLPGVTIVGPVKDVAAEYASARVMVVPLRAGSGTRIKILEAFSFGTPVVSTSMGAAGLAVTDDVHLLIADTPVEFAAACLRLLRDDRLAAKLAGNAHAWLRETHSLDGVRSVLHSLFPAPI